MSAPRIAGTLRSPAGLEWRITAAVDLYSVSEYGPQFAEVMGWTDQARGER